MHKEAERRALSACSLTMRIRAQIGVKMDEKELINVLSVLLDEKLQPVYYRLDSMGGRLDGMDSRFDGMDSRLDKMDSRLDKMDSRLDKMDSRLDKMDSRLDRVESEIGALKEGQQRLRQDLKRVSDKVNETYELALENWGQVQESKARLTALES